MHDHDAKSRELTLTEMIVLQLHAIRAVSETVGEDAIPDLIEARLQYLTLLEKIEREAISVEQAEMEYSQIHWRNDAQLPPWECGE